jgi:MoaA/NifB/PqqE/SkfB family radical SAM enzyme
LRELSDFKGDDLIQGVLDVVSHFRPLHLSLVGGDPLVRYREMEVLLPELISRGIHVQLVTSAFRPMAPAWGTYNLLNIVVSIDGLEADHNVRRTPATYERILNNISGQKITVHCTITGQMMKRTGYLEEFASFWHGRDEVKRLWFSLFTPQRGAELEEILTPSQRQTAVRDLMALRRSYPKIDMPEIVIREYLEPPSSPDDCIFARTTHTISADLKTMITPCQFGGDPDCSQCGCIASMGLAAIGNHRLGGILPVHYLFRASMRLGEAFGSAPPLPKPAPFPIIQ